MSAELRAPPASSHTIAEAAALTGLHKNTIRQKIKYGQLDADTRHGKFGEEYRIPHEALIRAGLIDGVLEGTGDEAAEIRSIAAAEDLEPAEGESHSPQLPALASSLGELFQRHENAMFRLGFMQAELERVKALAENAESLVRHREEQRTEMEGLRRELEQARSEADAAVALRQELDEAKERLRDAEGLRRVLVETEQEAERLRVAVEGARRPWWRRMFS